MYIARECIFFCWSKFICYITRGSVPPCLPPSWCLTSRRGCRFSAPFFGGHYFGFAILYALCNSLFPFFLQPHLLIFSLYPISFSPIYHIYMFGLSFSFLFLYVFRVCLAFLFPKKDLPDSPRIFTFKKKNLIFFTSRH